MKNLTYGSPAFGAATKSQKKSGEARCLFRFSEIVITREEIPPFIIMYKDIP